MINNVVIMGRLTKDAEERKTSNGKTVCSFCVAVDDSYNKDKAHFIDIIAWDKKAEFVIKYFRKGSMIAVQGRLTTRTWEDKNGSKHKAVEIVADAVSFCGDRKESTSGNSVDVPPPEDG
jgi:single-strand DNA-binding protein